jgi:hypothetical protein
MCNSRALGRVGVEQFYCWDCCIEFAAADDKIRMFEVQDDGSLTDIEDFEPENPFI